MSPAHPPFSLTIVTAGSAAYGRCLWQFLRDAQRWGLPGAYRLVAWDLGLSPPQRERLARDFPWCTWRTLDEGAWPAHVPAAADTYAWKPVVIRETMREFGGALLWLDSATLLHASLEPVAARIAEEGILSFRGQGEIWRNCHPDVLARLEVPVRHLDRPERAAGALGLDGNRPSVRRFLDEWCELCLDPRNVTRVPYAGGRHKREQAMLGIALFRAEDRGECVLGDDEIAVSSFRPVRWFSCRNKVPPWLPRSLDGAARAYYRLYWAIDRAGQRWRHARCTWLGGRHRQPREHFHCAATDLATGHTVAWPSPPHSFLADPFVVEQAGRRWVFAERFDYRLNRGVIACAELDALGRPGLLEDVIAPRYHVSFPFVFAHAGRHWLVPESTRNESIDLYVAESFPGRWRLARRMFSGIDAADSVLHHDGQRWWLLTSVRPPGAAGRHLEIHSTDDLLHGQWRPHPVNRQQRYADELHTSGRNAGPLIPRDGSLIRPVQWNRDYYGQSVRLHRIRRLDLEAFEEEPLPPDHDPLTRLAAMARPHHFSPVDSLVIWDRRDRVAYLQHVPIVGRLFGPR